MILFNILMRLWNGIGRVLEGVHASFVELVPFKAIAMFTIFQLLYFLVCFGITWIPIAGVLFPLPFFLLIGVRHYILPKMFHPNHLQELDSSGYEEIAGAPQLRVCFLSFDQCTEQYKNRICLLRGSLAKYSNSKYLG